MLEKLIAKPVEDEKTATLFKKQLHLMLFLRVVLLTLLLGINVLLQSSDKNIITPPLNYIIVFVGVVYLFTIASALILNFIRRYSTFTYIQLLMDVLLISILLFYSGGSQSIFAILYLFPIIAGGIILSRRGGLAAAAASTLAYGFILYLEYFGYHPQYLDDFWYIPLQDIRSILNFFSIHGLVFFITAILSSLLSERLRRTEKELISTTLKYDQLSELYKKIFDDIPSGIIVLNQKNIISFNPSSEHITGFRFNEVVGKNINLPFPGIKLDAEMNFRSEVEITTKDRKKIPIGYSAARLNMPGTDDDFRIVTLQDLSRTKEMERKIIQAEKMATIGEMSAGIAHELRNPLAAISGAAELIDASGDIKPQNQGLMNIITRECNRLQNSINDFLTFSKPLEPEKEWVPLLPLVQELIQLLQHTEDWPENCKSFIEIPEKMACWADPEQIRQVLLNIFHNSCVALRDRTGEIRIRAEEVTDDSGIDKTFITVSDNGAGIPDLIIEKIYEPFFTTHENGTGLGLSIARQIATTHGGGIIISSVEHQGTTAEIWLPLP
ncbi:MAG: PAS domain S-box protein [Deltaproteobacteria bacterium]|jgi:two-component system sensor histidine kinase PilS (NtrC family)|nr:PAS domain S-box protein [Deltaproteobacteria bacterium]